MSNKPIKPGDYVKCFWTNGDELHGCVLQTPKEWDELYYIVPENCNTVGVNTRSDTFDSIKIVNPPTIEEALIPDRSFDEGEGRQLQAELDAMTIYDYDKYREDRKRLEFCMKNVVCFNQPLNVSSRELIDKFRKQEKN